MSRLKDKVVVISGGTIGAGRAIAGRFVHERAHVFIFGRRRDATGIGRAAAKRFIEEGAFVYIFGRRQEALDAAVEAERGTLDIVFANAGVGSQLRLGEITAEIESSARASAT